MGDFLTYIAPELIYTLCGLVSLDCAFRALKNEEAKYGTFIFWAILGVIYIFGKLIPSEITGGLLLVMGALTITKQVKIGKFNETTQQERLANNSEIKSAIFIPAILIGALAFVFSLVKYTIIVDGIETLRGLDGAVMVGGACIIALIVACILCRPKAKETREDSSKLLMTVGATSLLPQLLGALGTLFSAAGVGDVISSIISNIVPDGNIVIGVIVYCLGMAIFTMIMGNGFAAFSVITAGIGVPFVIMQGGDPSIVGALGMTAGFCGTLLTPMAANFNIVPAAVLETRDKWTVIKTQLPMAIIILTIHIILMLTLAF